MKFESTGLGGSSWGFSYSTLPPLTDSGSSIPSYPTSLQGNSRVLRYHVNFTLILMIVFEKLLKDHEQKHFFDRYYNVSSFAVECTAMSNMFYYVVFIFPAAYYSELAGVRRTLILGSCLSCLGAWIKVYATSPDKFFWLLVGQSMVASCQVFSSSIELAIKSQHLTVTIKPDTAHNKTCPL